MRNERKVVAKLIESEKIYNRRLAEYFANRVRERMMKDDVQG